MKAETLKELKYLIFAWRETAKELDRVGDEKLNLGDALVHRHCANKLEKALGLGVQAKREKG